MQLGAVVLTLTAILGAHAAVAQNAVPSSSPPAASPAGQTLPYEYGAIISNENAKKVAAAALAEARRIGVPMVVAITDTAGHVIYQERQDGAILGGSLVAPEKALSAALYKRPTKVFEDAVAAPGGAGLRFLRLQGAVPIEGGLPLVLDSKIVGAIGMSGGSGVQDGLAAKAGADALK